MGLDKSDRRSYIGRMTPDDLRTLRKRLGLTQAELAERLRNSERSIRRYEDGERDIPGPVQVAVEAMLREAGHLLSKERG